MGNKNLPANTEISTPNIQTANFRFPCFSLCFGIVNELRDEWRFVGCTTELKEFVTDDYVPWVAQCLFWLLPPCLTTIFFFERNWFFRFRKLLWQAFATRFWIRRGDSPRINPITWNNVKYRTILDARLNRSQTRCELPNAEALLETICDLFSSRNVYMVKNRTES